MDRDTRLEELFAAYVDRLNTGEPVDRAKVWDEHPELADQLVPLLEEFIDAAVVDSANLGSVGDYTLRRQIGRGGMGVVYEAWENSIDRQVALKVLPAAIAADTRAVTRFVREAQVAGKLNHPNVVSIYGMGLKEQVPYYTMEYVDGETLSQILARTRNAESETPFGPKDQVDYFSRLARCFSEVAEGLQHAHSKGVIHRDVKPSNLILNAQGQLRILDFGLARSKEKSRSRSRATLSAPPPT